MLYTAADGLMVFYPLNNEKFSIILDEKTYVIVAGFIIIMAVFTFVWFYFRRNPKYIMPN